MLLTIMQQLMQYLDNRSAGQSFQTVQGLFPRAKNDYKATTTKSLSS